MAKVMTAEENSLKAQLVTAGVDSSLLDKAFAAGFSFLEIFALMVKYGPVFMDVLKTLLDRLNNPNPHT